MKEGAPGPEIELLPEDHEEEDARFRAEGAKNKLHAAEVISSDIHELQGKGVENLSEDEKGRLKRLQEAHAEVLRDAEALQNQK